MTTTVTPQSLIKARFAELADLLEVDLTVRRQAGKFYFTVVGPWERINEMIAGSFPRAWMTSCAGGPISDIVYGLPHDEVERMVQGLTLEPDWIHQQGNHARLIAEKIRDEQSFENLPILADALEEAGCSYADALTHCRQAGAHGSVCWVIEWLLGITRRPRRHHR